MRKWSILALIISICTTVGAALLMNASSANVDGGADIGAALLMIFGFLSTIVSIFAVLASSPASSAPDADNLHDETKTAWPRS